MSKLLAEPLLTLTTTYYLNCTLEAILLSLDACQLGILFFVLHMEDIRLHYVQDFFAIAKCTQR